MFEFYLFGLQRSGTNFAYDTLKMNFADIKQLNLLECPNDSPLWKHHHEPRAGFPNDAPVFAMYKNPYMWIESIKQRNAMDFNWSHTRQRDSRIKPMKLLGLNDNGTKNYREDSPNLARMWASHVQTWHLDNKYDHTVIRYEDLLVKDTLVEFLDKVQSKYGLTWIAGNKYKTPAPGEVINSLDFNHEMVDHYLKGQPTLIKQIYIDYVNEHVSDEIMEELNYKRVYETLKGKDSNTLLDSVKEMDQIIRGEKPPGRVTEIM